jgi:hypothetical protein
MENQPYTFELPDGRTVVGTRVIQRDAAGEVWASFLTDGRISLSAAAVDADSIDDGEPIDDAELERLARLHAGYR